MRAGAPEPRARAHPHRRAGRVRCGGVEIPRPARASAAFAIFNELGFRALAKEYAPTADTIAKTYRIVNTADGVRALAERLRAAGRFAFRVLPDGPTAMRAAIVGTVVLDLAARTATTCRSAIDRSTTPRALPLDIALDALRPLLEDEAIGEGRARPQVRRRSCSRVTASRCGASTSTRCWRATCWTRRAPATWSRISRSSTRATRRCRSRTSADAARRRSRSPTSRWTRRSTTPASAPICVGQLAPRHARPARAANS